jgi:hypothetical protein
VTWVIAGRFLSPKLHGGYSTLYLTMDPGCWHYNRDLALQFPTRADAEQALLTDGDRDQAFVLPILDDQLSLFDLPEHSSSRKGTPTS